MSVVVDANLLVALALNDPRAPAVDRHERSAYVRGIASAFFPEIDDEVIGGIEKIRQNDPWVKGAWGFFGPGEQGMFPVTKRPEGRVHFCGGHTSAWSGWMQGAFESANRAVNEITA